MLSWQEVRGRQSSLPAAGELLILPPCAEPLLQFVRYDMDYRPATFPDAAPIAALHALSWRRNYRGILPDRMLDGPLEAEHLAVWRERLANLRPERQLVLLACEQDALRGFVCILLDEEPAWGARLENLHVHPESRRKGVGQTLLGHAREWVAAMCPGQGLHLWVLAGNAPAIAFYEHLGGSAAQRSVWTTPGGDRVPELRYVWPPLGARPDADFAPHAEL